MTHLAVLREGLDELRRHYDARYLGSDPLAFPRRFTRSDDREVVGLVASALAYGNVKTIANSMERILSWMGPRPPSSLGPSSQGKLSLHSEGSSTGGREAGTSSASYTSPAR